MLGFANGKATISKWCLGFFVVIIYTRQKNRKDLLVYNNATREGRKRTSKIVYHSTYTRKKKRIKYKKRCLADFDKVYRLHNNSKIV